MLRSCLEAAEQLPTDWQIVALVHSKKLVNAARAKIVEIPWSKRTWFHRLYFEWVAAKKIAAIHDATIWLSLHDVTSNVDCPVRAVYCHNPSPFYWPTIRETIYEPKFAAFCLMYGLLYGVSISKNQWVVVQQQWLAKEFRERWTINALLVAHPESDLAPLRAAVVKRPACRVFSYPGLPRVYKNIEVVGEAIEILERDPRWRGEVRLTVSGTESRYARALSRKYSHLKTLRFCGRQSKLEMAAFYEETDCLLFPSKLETWGLPITEFKVTGRPMIIADLPYAFETVGDYANASFFPASDAAALARQMLDAQDGTFIPTPVDRRPPIAPPDVSTWLGLLQRIVAGVA